MDVGDYLCEFKHLCEVDISFAEKKPGQRLDIVKFPRIIGACWRERVREKREREGEREKAKKKRVVQRPSLGFP